MAEKKKRIQIVNHNILCMLCGEVLPFGMTAYQVSNTGDGSVLGFVHYGKCRGVLRAESDQRRLDYKEKMIEDLLDLVRHGTQSQYFDASFEIKQRIAERNDHGIQAPAASQVL